MVRMEASLEYCFYYHYFKIQLVWKSVLHHLSSVQALQGQAGARLLLHTSITAQTAAAVLDLQTAYGRHQPQEADRALNICRQMGLFFPQISLLVKACSRSYSK